MITKHLRLILCSMLMAISSHAAPMEDVQLTADQVVYDQETREIRAHGHVSIVYKERELTSDTITYHMDKGTTEARGNVTVTDASGQKVTADYMELDHELSEGIARHFRMFLADSANVLSSTADRLAPHLHILYDARYSACGICSEKDDPPLLWQLRSKYTVIDHDDESVRHRHVRLEAMGVPVFYSPFYSHPTPNAKRRSGFLTPSYGHSTDLGTFFKVPFYYTQASHWDATVTPTFYDHASPLIEGETRYLGARSRLTVKGSVTYPGKKKPSSPYGRNVRYHVETDGSFSASPHWTLGMRTKQASDDTYLRKYHLSEDSVYESAVYANYLESTTYSSNRMLFYQDLRPDAIKDTPFMVPYSTYTNYGTLADDRLHYQWDASLLSLHREKGAHMNRIHTMLHVSHRRLFANGLRLTTTPRMRIDGYAVQSLPHPQYPADRQYDYSGSKARIIPELEMMLDYPLEKHAHGYYWNVTPVTQLLLSSHVNETWRIPNEDASSIELMPDNLFASSRYYGLDRVESGVRGSYGVRAHMRTPGGKQAHMMLGQFYRDSARKQPLPFESGMQKKFSDYVGRLRIDPSTYYSLYYRFRMDPTRHQLNHNEIGLTLWYRGAYLTNAFLAKRHHTPRGTRKELVTTLGIPFMRDWHLEAKSRRSLSDLNERTKNRFLSLEGALLYTGTCIKVGLNYRRTFIRDRDIKPETFIGLQLYLRSLND